MGLGVWTNLIMLMTMVMTVIAHGVFMIVAMRMVVLSRTNIGCALPFVEP